MVIICHIVLGMMQQGMLLTNNYDIPVGCLVAQDGGQMS